MVRSIPFSAAVAALAVAEFFTAPIAASTPTPPLDPVANWGYYLDEVDPLEVAASGFDLVVIDYSQDGSGAREFDRTDLDTMQRKPDGSRRIVLAYLSIGEAETYRYYWKSSWQKKKPTWLDDENPDWEGNIKVRYWEPEWQDIIFGDHDAYLDRIMAAGFDGVYLDIIDAFEHYEDSRPSARADMADFVANLSRYAKGTRGSSFLVIGQNGESLASEPRYLNAIDGIAKEDLYFSWQTDGAPADPEETAESLAHLKKAKSAGKKVLVVEYVSNKGGVAETYSRAKSDGFVPHAARRDLDRLVVNEGFDPPTTRPYSGEGDQNDHVDWFDPRSSKFSDALFYATTLPRGTTQLTLSSDYYTENYEFSTEDFRGEEQDFITDDFYEWTTAVTIRHAVTENLELGIRLPFVYSEIDAPTRRGVHNGYHRSESGLGNIGLIAAYGTSWGKDDSDILLIEGELGLPTDTRSDDFSGGGHGTVSATYEHYWDRFGITASIGADYYAESGYSNGEWEVSYLAGPNYQWTDRLYTSFLVGQREFDQLIIEANASYLLNSRTSLDLSFGKELTGDIDATYISLGLNYIFGGGKGDGAKPSAPVFRQGSWK